MVHVKISLFLGGTFSSDVPSPILLNNLWLNSILSFSSSFFLLIHYFEDWQHLFFLSLAIMSGSVSTSFFFSIITSRSESTNCLQRLAEISPNLVKTRVLPVLWTTLIPGEVFFVIIVEILYISCTEVTSASLLLFSFNCVLTWLCVL